MAPKPPRQNAESTPRAADPKAGGELTHLSPEGDARMVDVGDKPITARRAVAAALVRMRPATAQRIVDQDVPKGDVLAAARLGGIMAAKRTSELVPLCHPLALTRVTVDIEVHAADGTVHVQAAAEARDRTGVEMEALTAASVACLTIYDMVKSIDRGTTIERIALLEKSGGKSGHYRREAPPA